MDFSNTTTDTATIDTSQITAWIAQSNKKCAAQASQAAQAIIINPRPLRPHIYHPDQIDALIELLNDELDDEAKMRLVMKLPALQGHLKAD